MKKLKVDLKNCFGIKSLDKDFYFEFERKKKGEIIETIKANTFALYAPNGTMKTSFAKVFQHLQKGTPTEFKKIRDNILDIDGEPKITIDGREITKDDIFVIPSFESTYEVKDLANLLIDEASKIKLKKTLDIKKTFIAFLANQSGFAKKTDEMEEQLRSDFGIDNFLPEVNSGFFDSLNLEEDFSAVQYKNIFDNESVILKSEFQENIENFIREMETIYSTFTFIKPKEFSLGKIKKVAGELDKNNFFVGNNSVNLDGISGKIKDLPGQIEKVETAIEANTELKKIKKVFETVGGINLLEEIEKGGSEIIPYLTKDNLPKLRIQIWLSYISKNISNFEALKKAFSEFQSTSSLSLFEETNFYHAYKIFKNRFIVPFKMDIENKEGCILAESPPKITFKFENPETGEYEDSPHSRKKIEEDILSQGEKRALYLLNIILDIESIKQNIQDPDNELKEKLLIIDDIADSFDYKNKYAIIEYLRDIAEWEYKNESGEIIKPFYSIILSHNFDFFRTIQDRILGNSIKRENSFIIERSINETLFIPAGNKNITHPFDKWKNEVHNNVNSLISAIPFIRNLIEYKSGTKDPECVQLTYCLHQKEENKTNEDGHIIAKKTDNITISDLEQIFTNHIKCNNFEYTEEEKNKTIKELLNEIVSEIIKNDFSSDFFLENKLLLSISIRLEAEMFMWSKVSNKTTINRSQTGKLYQRYKEEFGKNKVLDSVNIMTPENIHLNSFMYEPILDMGIDELKELYKKVKDLNNE